jgi:hypothetical protein
MTITLSIWIVAAQWVLLACLGLLVITLYRQFAYYTGLKHRGNEAWGLSLGNAAPTFSYRQLSANQEPAKQFQPHGTRTLLIFADPHCGSCERGLTALRQILMNEPSKVPELLIVTGSALPMIAASGIFAPFAERVALTDGDRVLDAYEVRQTPFGFLIDEGGIIRAKGVVDGRAGILDLLKAKRGAGAITTPSLALKTTSSRQ